MALTRRRRRLAVLAAASLVCAFSVPAMNSAMADESPSPEPSVATADQSPSADPSAQASPSPSATPTPEASASPSPSASATPSTSASPSASPSPSASTDPDEGVAATITLCHATGDADVPFESVTLDAADVTADGVAGHRHADDIIPAVGDFAGQNLDTRYLRGVTGDEVLAAGCEVSPADRVNEGPVVVVDAVEVIGNVGTTLEISGSFMDPDGDDLVLTADNEVGDFVDNGDGTWTWTLDATADLFDGTVVVTAADPKGSEATDTFTFRVNHKPLVDVYATAVQVNEGQPVVLGGSFIDPDGDPLVITSDATSGTFSDNGDGTWYWILDTNSETADGSITVTATDEGELSASDTVGYRVNQAPVVAQAAVSVEATAGDTVRVSGAFRDADGDPLVLMADNTLVTFSDHGDGTWSYELVTDGFTPSDMVIRVTARDSAGLTASDTFRIRVNPVPVS